MGEIAGAAVATVTPFGPGGRDINLDFIASHLDLLRSEGAQGIVPVGTNGEFPSLALDEKKRLLAAAGRDKGDLFLIAGVGSCCVAEVIELADYAADAGADAALVVPPFYFKDAGPPGIVEFYRQALKSIELPVLLYNIPSYSGITISDEIIDSLAEHPNLAGIKDTGGNPETTRRLVRKYPHLKIFGGSDSLVGDAIAAGAAGVISGVANVFPGLLRQAWDARAGGADGKDAAGRVRAARQVFKSFPWIAATKYALKLRGFPETFVRPPLMDLTGEQKRDLESRLAEMGLL